MPRPTWRRPITHALVRDARPEDNAALLALAAACPMEGRIGVRVDREPDFLALCRLWGDPWTTLVATTPGGEVVGCIGFALRSCHLLGSATRMGLVGDLKVHPAHRGPREAVADTLIAAAREVCAGIAGKDVPVLFTILAGNDPMEKRIPGPRGLPAFTRFSTMCAWSLPLLRRFDGGGGGRYRVEPARPSDVEEMMELWRRWAPRYQCTPVFDAASFLRWIDAAPGLHLEDYGVVRDGNGRIAAFGGFWDQETFKQLRVTGYSRGLAMVRALYNRLGPLRTGGPLPGAGGALPCVAAVHLCTPPDDPAPLRALVLDALRRLAGTGCALVNVGLDRSDPRRAALRGLFAPPTAIHAYVTTPAGRYTGPSLADRPLQHDLALV